jgi:hypothetical protein
MSASDSQFFSPTESSDLPVQESRPDPDLTDRLLPAKDSRAFLTPLEFAQYTGYSISTIRRYLKAGKLKKLQPGGPDCAIQIPAEEARVMNESVGHSFEETNLEADPPPILPPKQSLSGPAPRWKRKRNK